MIIMELLFQVRTRHPKRNRIEWSKQLTEAQINTLLSANRIKPDDRVRYADQDEEIGSVAELLEIVATTDSNAELQAYDQWLEDDSEYAFGQPPKSRAKQDRPAATDRLTDGIHSGPQQMPEAAVTESRGKLPIIITTTQTIGYVAIIGAVFAGVISLEAFASVSVKDGPAAVGARIRAGFWLYSSLSSGCAAVFILGWAFLLQSVWEIRHGYAPPSFKQNA